MSESLFNGEDKFYSWTKEAGDLDRELITAIKEVFNKYVALGYSPREIAHIAYGAVSTVECEKVVRMRMDHRRAEEAKKNPPGA